VEEVNDTQDEEKRDKILTLVPRVRVIPITPEMTNLVNGYLERHVFSPAVQDDALHVAAAVLSGHDALVSWNFKHLVNRARRERLNQMHRARGLPELDILAPPEV
jgi:hypothetical protein